jgi:competence protein ComEC
MAEGGVRSDQRTRLRRTASRFRLEPAGLIRDVAARLDLARLSLGATLEREIEDGRGFLWLPVLFGIGVLVYFALPREPAFAAMALIAVALTAGAIVSRRLVLAFRVLVCAAAIAIGATAAKLRTDLVAEPRLEREVTADITGWIAEEGATPRGGARLVLRVQSIAGVKPDHLPLLARITVRPGTSVFAVGDAVAMRVRLRPPSGPAMPGGYAFARAAYYERLGAVGFAYGPPRRADLGSAPWSVRVWRPLEELRDLIRIRIEAALPGDNGRIAAALIMGDQGGISGKTQDAMRASGLGHVLSISGLHMALIAGSAFWAIRALLALFPSLALRRPIKKWAAVGGLLVATIYLGISGGGVATERAYVMLSVMLVAILLDRRALTLRNVAIAALLVLVFAPENLLSVSFQMSFAATAALVSAYEALARHEDRRASLADPFMSGFGGRAWRWGFGLFLTSLIAGIATTPFAAFHFQRTAPLSLVANLAAMPVVGIVVMPMALLAVLVMPLGLESLPLAVMDWGLDWMNFVAARTAAWSEGMGDVRAAPVAALLLVVAGFLWLTLWRERWRLAGIVPIVAAIPVALIAPVPDILVSDSGRAVAVRGEDGKLRVAGGKDESFVVETWLRADADGRDPKAAGLDDGVRCDALGCIVTGAGGTRVSLVLKPEAFAEDCILASVVVSRFAAPEGCAAEATVIDRDPLRKYGAQALYRAKSDGKAADGPDDLPAGKAHFETTTAWPAVHRPWMPGGGEAAQ